MTTSPYFKSSFTSELILSIAGPERPKCVNRTLPRFTAVLPATFAPFWNNVILAFFNETPERALTQGSLTVMGTRAAVGGEMVCPSLVSQANPSPVEPVSGWDLPPVAKMKARAKIFSPFSNLTAVICLESFVSNPTTSAFERTVTGLLPPCLVSFIFSRRTSQTDSALSVVGKTR